jgi:hypothetical protein
MRQPAAAQPSSRRLQHHDDRQQQKNQLKAGNRANRRSAGRRPRPASPSRSALILTRRPGQIGVAERRHGRMPRRSRPLPFSRAGGKAGGSEAGGSKTGGSKPFGQGADSGLSGSSEEGDHTGAPGSQEVSSGVQRSEPGSDGNLERVDPGPAPQGGFLKLLCVHGPLRRGDGFLLANQRVPGHLVWLRHPHQVQERRRQVGQAAFVK